MTPEISRDMVDRRYRELARDAESAGYFLNSDNEFTTGLIEGLLINKGRYGYESCPCRLSTGNIDDDRDIICPCDYRDPDLSRYGACYCGLYVSKDLFTNRGSAPSIPERRPPFSERQNPVSAVRPSGLPYPVWRCRVCGYLAAREEPPEICPICKAKKDRFEKFLE